MDRRVAPAASRRFGNLSFRTAVHRWLFVHRRPISAALAFAAVLFGLAAVTSTPRLDARSGAATQTSAAGSTVGALEVPVRLADASVTSVISPGDVVDVVVAGPRAVATVVAAEVVVTALPSADGDDPWSSSDGLVMVAATEAQALALAGAAARGPVTIVLHR